MQICIVYIINDLLDHYVITVFAEGEDSIVQRVFGGLLRSDVTCGGCGYTSTAFDPFLDLSLDLPPQLPHPQARALYPKTSSGWSHAGGVVIPAQHSIPFWILASICRLSFP